MKKTIRHRISLILFFGLMGWLLTSCTRSTRPSSDTVSGNSRKTHSISMKEKGTARMSRRTVYSVIDLGTLPDYKESTAVAINDKGQVLCLASGKVYDFSHSFLWENQKRIDLGTLGGEACNAESMNDLGQVVGSSMLSNGRSHGFLWQRGRMRDLGTLGGKESEATGINNQAVIVGRADTTQGVGHVFILENDQMRDIQDSLPGPDINGHPVRINDKGEIAGSFQGEKRARAFLYRQEKAEALPTLGGDFGNMLALNNQTALVGVSESIPGSHAIIHAYLWQNETIQDLDTSGGTHSAAWGMNNKGQVVGQSDIKEGFPHAFLWSDGDMVDLNTVIPPDSGWELENAVSINDQGFIVGDGLYKGKRRAFLLVPKEQS